MPSDRQPLDSITRAVVLITLVAAGFFLVPISALADAPKKARCLDAAAAGRNLRVGNDGKYTGDAGWREDLKACRNRRTATKYEKQMVDALLAGGVGGPSAAPGETAQRAPRKASGRFKCDDGACTCKGEADCDKLKKSGNCGTYWVCNQETPPRCWCSRPATL